MTPAPAPIIRDEALASALAAISAGYTQLAALNGASLSVRERIEVLRQLEQHQRTSAAIGDDILIDFTNAAPHEYDGRPADMLANALRINQDHARARIRTAAKLGQRRTLTGEPLAPEYAESAAGAHAGIISRDHVRVIEDFFRHVPGFVDNATRVQAEATLAGHAHTMRPDELRKAAERILAHLHPDGDEPEERDRARRRHFTMGRQGIDKMTSGTFCLDPELRATLEALFAKFAAPGMCNPADQAPTVDGAPSVDTVTGDTRSVGQRQHDALKATARAMIASGELGQHRGLPVTVIVSTTLDELTRNDGHGVTGGGSLLPITDVLRMGRHAFHYLVIFDKASNRPLYLGRTKRIATADQRIVLHASQRGCTFPGCTRPGYLVQTHHAQQDWLFGGRTDASDLAFACDIHHPLAGNGEHDWQTFISGANDPFPGRTYWVPPAIIDPERKPRLNRYHHPGDYFHCDDEPETRKAG